MPRMERPKRREKTTESPAFTLAIQGQGSKSGVAMLLRGPCYPAPQSSGSSPPVGVQRVSLKQD